MTDILYGERDAEQLETCEHDYMMYICEELMPDQLDNEIEIWEWKPKDIIPEDLGAPLEYVLEALEEEYGDWEGTFEQPHMKAMREAERQFVKRIAGLYVPWQCEPVKPLFKMTFRKYLEENDPKMLAEILEEAKK